MPYIVKYKAIKITKRRIPELEGKRKQLEDQVLSFMKEIDSVHADLEKIDLYRLSAEKKETIRELCKQKPLLDQDLTRLKVNVKKRMKSCNRKMNN